MQGYKVVREKDDGRFMSATSCGIVMLYGLGVWTQQPGNGGPLAVFDTLENATEFVSSDMPTGARIFMCEYEPSEYARLWFDVPRHSSHQVPRRCYRMQDCPQGTILAATVTLLEEV